MLHKAQLHNKYTKCNISKHDHLPHMYLHQVHLHNKYTKYAFLFFVCELLNLFVVLLIVFLIDRLAAFVILRSTRKISKI